MKYTVRLERVMTHSVEIEIDADNNTIADSRSDILVDHLDDPHHQPEEWLMDAAFHANGGWELEEEQYEVLSVEEGGL